MKKILFLITLSLFGQSLLAQTSYISKTQTLTEGGTEFGVESITFVPTIHSDASGETVKFEEEESYMRTDLEIAGKYGFTNNLQTNFGVRLRYNQSSQTYNDEKLSLTASGAESAFISLKYAFEMEKGLQYSLEANYRHKLFKNEDYDSTTEPTKIVLGDDGTDVSLGFGVTYYTKSSNFFSGRFLYRNPGEKLSSELFSELEYAIAWPYFTLLAGIETVTSLNGDPYESDPTEKPQISSGSTYEYNSINRSWGGGYLGMNFALGKSWRLELKAKTKAYGVSTDLGNSILISLQKRSDSPKYFERKDAAFKQYKAEGSVTKVSKKKTAIAVDIGLKDGLEKGTRVDFYHFDYLGGNQLIASGYAVKVGLSKAIIKVTKRYSKIRIEAGTTLVRAGLIKE